MIVESVMSVIFSVIDFLLFFDIPDLPSQVHYYIDQAFSYIAAGVGIFANYAPMDYLLVLFGVILAIDVAIAIYHLVMWVIKKIPFLGME